MRGLKAVLNGVHEVRGRASHAVGNGLINTIQRLILGAQERLIHGGRTLVRIEADSVRDLNADPIVPVVELHVSER